MARLEVVAGRAVGMSILLDDELLIGRHAEGAGRLADDDEISRSHARISLDRSGFCAIEDLGSTNGTFVNGLRIAGPQTLSVGDTIELGGTTLVARELPIPATERSLKAVPPQPTAAPGTSVPAPTTSQETPAIALGPSGKPQRGPRPLDQALDSRPAEPPTTPGAETAPGPRRSRPPGASRSGCTSTSPRARRRWRSTRIPSRSGSCSRATPGARPRPDPCCAYTPRGGTSSR